MCKPQLPGHKGTQRVTGIAAGEDAGPRDQTLDGAPAGLCGQCKPAPWPPDLVTGPPGHSLVHLKLSLGSSPSHSARPNETWCCPSPGPGFWVFLSPAPKSGPRRPHWSPAWSPHTHHSDAGSSSIANLTLSLFCSPSSCPVPTLRSWQPPCPPVDARLTVDASGNQSGRRRGHAGERLFTV